jgi:hypothetical protein
MADNLAQKKWKPVGLIPRYGQISQNSLSKAMAPLSARVTNPVESFSKLFKYFTRVSTDSAQISVNNSVKFGLCVTQ